MASEKVSVPEISSGGSILKAMSTYIGPNLLDRWFPLAVDGVNGGYYTDITYDWKIAPRQHKMIVTQARQVWTASKAAIMFGNQVYADAAVHGFEFLRNSMWDPKYGGFFQMRDQRGMVCDHLGFFDEKRTYGNAFGIYGLAALYRLTKDSRVLDFAKEAFRWVEEHAYDPEGKGYFQFIGPDGNPFDRSSSYKTKAYDSAELGYKDQNSSIHLLEAYSELYNVWPDPLLKERISALLSLTRDVITTEEGYMNLFFHSDWTPLSFRQAPRDVREKSYNLDHVSFGHDYETAFLMLEASYALGLEEDTVTLSTAKRMVDHAIANGWDEEYGGFFDAGYYLPDQVRCTIIRPTKNWWAQAEALNILLMMSRIFPEDTTYSRYFVKQWEYVDKYLLDHEYGDWFEGGLDKEPQFKYGPKGHIWKCNYHTGRAMMNCIKMLVQEGSSPIEDGRNFRQIKKESERFIEHWGKTAKGLS